MGMDARKSSSERKSKSLSIEDEFKKYRQKVEENVSLVDVSRVVCGNVINTKVLDEAVQVMKTRPTHCLLYVDRMDCYRTDSSDDELVEHITRHMSPKIWDRAIIVLTHAQMVPPKGNVAGAWTEFSEKRANQIREVIGRHIRNMKKAKSIPFVGCENSSRCQIDTDTGCKKLPDGSLWITDMYRLISDISTNVGPIPPLNIHEIIYKSNPDNQNKNLVPFLVAAQAAATLWIAKSIYDDMVDGDFYGPFKDVVRKEKRKARNAGRDIDDYGKPFRLSPQARNRGSNKVQESISAYVARARSDDSEEIDEGGFNEVEAIYKAQGRYRGSIREPMEQRDYRMKREIIEREELERQIAGDEADQERRREAVRQRKRYYEALKTRDQETAARMKEEEDDDNDQADGDAESSNSNEQSEEKEDVD